MHQRSASADHPELAQHGHRNTIASGNDGFTNAVSAPGCIPEAVTVGSTTKSDTVSSVAPPWRLPTLPGRSPRCARRGLHVVRVFLEGAVSAFSERSGPSDRVSSFAREFGIKYQYFNPILT